MKKFLTVLLVVAVMFTFSFGTTMAFAVTNSVDTFRANVDKAASNVLIDVKAAHDKAGAAAATVSNYYMDKEQVQAVYDGYQTVLEGQVAAIANDIKKFYNAYGDKDVADLEDMFTVGGSYEAASGTTVTGSGVVGTDVSTYKKASGTEIVDCAPTETFVKGTTYYNPASPTGWEVGETNLSGIDGTFGNWANTNEAYLDENFTQRITATTTSVAGVTRWYKKGVEKAWETVDTTDFVEAVANSAWTTNAITIDSFAADAIVYANNSKAINAAAKAQFDIDKAEALAALNAVDLSAYSKDAVEGKVGTVASYTSYYDWAAAIVDAAVASVTNVTLASTATVSDAVTAAGKIGTIPAKATAQTATNTTIGGGYLDVIQTVVSDTKNLDDKYEVTGYELKPVDGLKTSAKEASEALEAAASRDSLKAWVNAQAAAFAQSVVNDTKNATTNNQLKADYVELMNYLIDNTADKDLADLASACNASATNYALGTAAPYTATKKLFDAVKTYTEKKVTEKEDGALVWDEEEVNDALEEELLKIAAYGLDNTAVETEATIEGRIFKDANKAAATLDQFEIDKKVAALEAELEALEDDYYAPEYEQITTLYNDAIEAAKAATTADELSKVKVDTTAKAKIKDAAAVNTAIGPTVNSEKTKLESYLDYLDGLATGTDNVKSREAIDDAFGGSLVEWYAEQGARTADEVKALYDTAKAVIDGAKTVAEVKEDQKAAEEAIKALPTTITAADQEAVAAAQKLADDCAVEPSNMSTLNLAVKSLANAMQKDIKAAEAALPTTAKVTPADKDAVKAVQDQIDAYNALQDEDGAFENNAANFPEITATDPLQTKVDALLDEIQKQEDKAVEDAIKALPAKGNITLDDKAAIEAAKAAYDAYVAEYSDPETGVDARNDIANGKELEAAVKALNKLIAADEAEKAAEAEAAAKAAIESVEKLKITASSTAGKGYIKVKWTVEGDEANVEGWEIWKSTKKSSGFKKAYTQVASKHTYKNTKGLKAGTRYYYKVRAIAYDADGNKVKSDWSNKAYRKAK